MEDYIGVSIFFCFIIVVVAGSRHRKKRNEQKQIDMEMGNASRIDREHETKA